MNEVDNEPATQAIDIVNNYIKKNPSLGISIELQMVEGNRTESKKFLENSKFRRFTRFSFEKPQDPFECIKSYPPNNLPIKSQFKNKTNSFPLYSLQHLYGSCEKQSSTAHHIRYNDHKCRIRNGEIIIGGTWYTNSQCIIWSGG